MCRFDSLPWNCATDPAEREKCQAIDLWFNRLSSGSLFRAARWHLLAASLSVKLAQPCRWPSKVYFCQVMTVIMNVFALHSSYYSSRARMETFRLQRRRGADHSESDRHSRNSWWIVRFPTSSVRGKKVEVLLPYQSVLQRLQLPLDCLTFFINSQVILFPWQQFPADTKNQVSPWKFKSLAGSLSVFICVQLHHHFQLET